MIVELSGIEYGQPFFRMLLSLNKNTDLVSHFSDDPNRRLISTLNSWSRTI
ncbi:hypothetical protein BN1088_40015 [Sphingobacterium sp. PM2-P1-29]|nr:hypothetical protein BN1088_40015 [Sphingobacterium sp. PM2-P1-29]